MNNSSQVCSYTYQTSAKEYWSLRIESEKYKNMLEQMKQILESSLYKADSKVQLCEDVLKENKF